MAPRCARASTRWWSACSSAPVQDEVTGTLPGGMQQRVALASAVLHRPRIVFLDEPTAGVDPRQRRAFWQLIRELAAQGTTVFVTTHYMDEAEYCARIGIMVDGRLVALDTPEGLKRTHAPGRVLEVRGPDLSRRAGRAARRAGRAGREPLRRGGHRARGPGATGRGGTRALAARAGRGAAGAGGVRAHAG